VVPEFGAIAAIVMAIAIVGIIVATTRYNKFNFFRQ
jgi:predicted secreted protein with PEFG-CTERM motif